MKFILIAILLTSPAFADWKVLSDGLRTLEDPAAYLNETCDASDPTAPAWCATPSTAVCAISRTATTTAATYDSALMATHVTSLPPTASVVDIARGKENAITAAENETATRTNISTADLTTLMTEIKASVIREINSSTIPAETKTGMVNRISGITYKSSTQYLESLKTRFRAQGLSEDDILTTAITAFEARCGSTGMEVNGFYNAEVNAFVICPGFVQHISEYGKPKAEMLNGLSFVVTHEISHSIDGNTNRGADIFTTPATVYEQMKTCYETQEPTVDWANRKGEIISDYWATRVFAGRLREQNKLGQDAITNMSLALNSLCTSRGGGRHPPGLFRINNIVSRDPQIRTQLECAPPTAQAPYCGLNGPVPAAPTVATGTP